MLIRSEALPTRPAVGWQRRPLLLLRAQGELAFLWGRKRLDHVGVGERLGEVAQDLLVARGQGSEVPRQLAQLLLLRGRLEVAPQGAAALGRRVRRREVLEEVADLHA